MSCEGRALRWLTVTRRAAGAASALSSRGSWCSCSGAVVQSRPAAARHRPSRSSASCVRSSSRRSRSSRNRVRSRRACSRSASRSSGSSSPRARNNSSARSGRSRYRLDRGIAAHLRPGGGHPHRLPGCRTAQRQGRVFTRCCRFAGAVHPGPGRQEDRVPEDVHRPLPAGPRPDPGGADAGRRRIGLPGTAGRRRRLHQERGGCLVHLGAFRDPVGAKRGGPSAVRAIF